MTASLHITPSRATSSNGLNLDGAKWYFYQTGTTTPQSVYTTAALSTPHANPVVADAAGKFANIYFDASLTYRGVLKSSDDATTIYDIDPINTDVFSSLAASGGSALIGFLQAGTGAVARTAQAKMRDIVDARDFGVTANGVTNDAPALQAAIDYCRTAYRNLKLPAGQILVNSPIDCTGLFAGGLSIIGEGGGIFNAQKTTCIRGNTGGIVIDASGTQYLGLRNLQIDCDGLSSTIGVLTARAVTSLYAQFCQWDDVSIRMPTNMAANGGTGTYAILNVAGEIQNGHNLYLVADNPIACIANKPAWLSSTFVTLDSVFTSMSVVSFTGYLSLQGLSSTRPAFRGEVLKACHIDQIYTIGLGTFAFDFDGCENITVNNGSIEGQGYKLAMLRNGCQNIAFNIYFGGTCTGAPIEMPSGFSAVRNISLRSTYRAGWSYIIESANVGNVLEGVSLSLSADAGTVATSNMANTSNILRMVSTGLSTGGPQDLDLIRPRILDYQRFNTIAAASAANSSVFLDTADGILKYKNSGGTVRPLSSIAANVADPAGGATVDTEARTAIIAIIDALQGAGLML